jgi:hypothetical protein
MKTKVRRYKRKRVAAVHGAAELVRTMFPGLDIYDADDELRLIVRERDIKEAAGSNKDPVNCALARACANQLGSAEAIFLRTHAWVEQVVDAKGTRRVMRYSLPKSTRDFISAFDRGQEVKGDVLVTLKPPPASKRREYIREKYERRKARKALVRGTIPSTSSTAGVFTKPRMMNVDVRNGTGLIQYAVKKTKARA